MKKWRRGCGGDNGGRAARLTARDEEEDEDEDGSLHPHTTKDKCNVCWHSEKLPGGKNKHYRASNKPFMEVA
jgi:hypothetical protein